MKELELALTFFVLCLSLAIFIAGFKASMFDNGPSPFELICMLWRGEIKSRYRR